MMKRFAATSLAVLVGACTPAPVPKGVSVEADGETVRLLGDALRAVKAPRLASIGQALKPCDQGAVLNSTTPEPDTLGLAVKCAPVQVTGLRGSWRAGADVWRFRLEDEALLISPPADSILSPVTRDVVGFRSDAALATVAWATRPETLARAFKGDLTAAMVSPLIDGTFAVVVFPGSTPSDFPQLAARFGVKSVPATLINKLAEDAAQRLGTSVVRSGAGDDLRWCLENLAVVPGLSPCLQTTKDGVVAAFNERTIELALAALGTAAPARIEVNLAAVDDNDRRRGLDGMGWPVQRVLASPTDAAVRVTVVK